MAVVVLCIVAVVLYIVVSSIFYDATISARYHDKQRFAEVQAANRTVPSPSVAVQKLGGGVDSKTTFGLGGPYTTLDIEYYYHLVQPIDHTAITDYYTAKLVPLGWNTPPGGDHPTVPPGVHLEFTRPGHYGDTLNVSVDYTDSDQQLQVDVASFLNFPQD